jgi:hypothetical protein
MLQDGLRQQDVAYRYDEHEGDDKTGHDRLDEHGASSERGSAHWTDRPETRFTSAGIFLRLPGAGSQAIDFPSS